MEQHLVDLKAVLVRLQQQGLVLNVEKCLFAASELDYLGHRVTASGIRPLPDRVQALAKYPQPKTVAQLQTFLGMANFYRRFIRSAAQILRPLTDALRGGQQVQLTWTAEMTAAFSQCKEAICNAAELAHPDQDGQLFLVVDASATHVGVAIQQEVPGASPRPLAFFSAKLSPAQAKYSAFDRELLACYLAIRHFRWLLEGRQFYLVTDHKRLTFAMAHVSDAWLARQQRQLSYMAEYTADIRHVPGKQNVVTDALSRPAAAIAAPASRHVDFAVLSSEQGTCTDTQELARGSTLQLQTVEVAGKPVMCDISTGLLRPLVPASQRKNVFHAIHDIAHPGTRATRRMITGRFVWRGCAADVARWYLECTQCARAKVNVHVKTAVDPIPLPARKFRHVHVDIVGPLPVAAQGFSYVLTMIDRTSRWPEAVPLADIAAETCVDAFVSGWVARHGVPHTVTTDRGTQFVSSTWQCLARKLGFRHITTTSYHPQANGMVERLHRQVKDSLRARQCGTVWLDHLPWTLLGLRAAPKDDSGISSAEVVFGEPLHLPGQLHVDGNVGPPEGTPPAAQPPSSIPLRPRTYAEAACGPLEQLARARYVFVRKGPVGGPLALQYEGPYEVLDRTDKVFCVQCGPRVEVISADRLKPYGGTERPAVATPPRRGRPPGTGGNIQPSSGEQDLGGE
jgi:transposase InsO family protein